MAQYLSGPLIQFLRNPVELGLRMCGEIRAPREILTKESVCVFIGAALPGALGIAKIHMGVRRQGEGLVVREFHASIPGQRLT